MEHTDHSIRNHYIAAVLAELTVIIVTSIASVVYPPLGHALWAGITEASPSGWFLVILAMILAGTFGCWVAGIGAPRTRTNPAQLTHDETPTTHPTPKTYSATISRPADKEMTKPGWVPVEGTYTGSKEHYWLLNNKGNEYWPHIPLELLPGGSWHQEIYLSQEVKPRNVIVILAWVSPEMHSILESWKSKSKITTNWSGLKMTPPAGHFVEMAVHTLQIPGTPEVMQLKLLSSHV